MKNTPIILTLIIGNCFFSSCQSDRISEPTVSPSDLLVVPVQESLITQKEKSSSEFETEGEEDPKKQATAFEKYGIKVVPAANVSYTTTVKDFADLRTQYQKKQYMDQDSTDQWDSLRVAFTHQLVNTIFPYWYGTEWDFNGYTNVPKKGTIACGYFVSTTLKHAGMNLNRYKLAQQSALNGIKTLQPKGNYRKYLQISQSEFSQKIKSELKEGLYMVGLDFHVGYILLKNGEAFFIHSDYISDQVKIERVEDSLALGQSKSFYLGDITYNDYLLKAWLKGEELQIITK